MAFLYVSHVARMTDETDAKKILTASSFAESEETTRTQARTMWMKTIQQDLKSNNLSLNEATDEAQNRPLWRLMSAFGAASGA